MPLEAEKIDVKTELFRNYVEYLKETKKVTKTNSNDLYLFAQLYYALKGFGSPPSRRILWREFISYLQGICKAVKRKKDVVICE